MQKILLVVLCSILTACAATPRAVDLDISETSIPEGKGILYYRIGYKTINDKNMFPNQGFSVAYSYDETDENGDEKTYREQLVTYSAELQETNKPDHRRLHKALVMDVGSYTFLGGRVITHWPVKPDKHDFKIKEGRVTYIGDFDYHIMSEVRDAYPDEIKRQELKVSCDKKRAQKELGDHYSILKEKGFLSQCHKKASYRMRPISSGATVINVYHY